MIPTSTALAQGSPPQFGNPTRWYTRFAGQDPEHASPCGLAVADVVGVTGGPDGRPDVIVANVGDATLGGSVAVFANTGNWASPANGLMLTHVIYPAPKGPPLYAVEAGDIDGDGDLDIVAIVRDVCDLEGAGRTLYVLIRNNGNGQLEWVVQQPVLSEGDYSRGVEVAHFNAPPKADVGLTVEGLNCPLYPPPEQGAAQIEVRWDLEQWTSPEGPVWTEELPYAPDDQAYPFFGSKMSDLVASFFRQNVEPPLLDLVAGFEEMPNLFFILNTGARAFSIQGSLSHQEGRATPTNGMAAGWFRQGTIRDLAVAGQTGPGEPAVLVLKNRGDGWFLQPDPIRGVLAMPLNSYGPLIGAATANINDDNMVDIAAVYSGTCGDCLGAGVAIWRGKPSQDPELAPEFLEGEGEPRLFPMHLENKTCGPMYVRLADLNGDNQRDVVVTLFGTGELSVRLNTMLVIDPGS